MTDEEEAALLAEGQAIADQQMLETLLELDGTAWEYFNALYELYGGDLDAFIQYWREAYEG